MIQWFVELTTFSRNNVCKGFVYDFISLTHHCDGILTHSYLVASTNHIKVCGPICGCTAPPQHFNFATL